MVAGDRERDYIERSEDGLRHDEVVPLAEEGDQVDGTEHRSHEGKHDLQKGTDLAGTIDAGALSRRALVTLMILGGG